MAPPPVIRLHPDDSVVIARATLLPGTPVADGVAACRAHSRRPQGRGAADRRGRAGAPLWPDHRLRLARDRARPARARAELRDGRLRQGLRLRRRREADRLRQHAGDVRRHPPARRPRRDAQLHRHPDQRELLGACRGADRRCVPPQSVHRRRSAGGVSQCRWRGRADPQDRLRHDRERAAARAAPHARRLRAARQLLACRRAGPGLRGEPDPRPDGGTAAGRPHPQHGHPVDGRHAQDGRSRRRVREGGAGRGEPGAARTGAGERTDRGAAMRRIGRLFRRIRQSRARCGERSAGAAWRHGDPVGDAGDLWRRASADAPRGVARGRREAGRR